MITYNHKDYIEEAILGVLMQETDFDYELIVANDCSPDSTDSVVNNLIEVHPRGNRIRYYRHSENIGMMPNFIFALNKSKSKYIALCEGDDYWVDSFKLQKQVDFLEANNGYSLCYHSCSNQYEQKGYFVKRRSPNKDDISLKNIIAKHYIPTASMVFRNLEMNLPDWFAKVASGDIALVVFLWKKGKIKYFKERMSVYRITGKGVSTTHNGYRMVHMRAYLFAHINEYLDYKYEKEIYEALFEFYKRYIGEKPESIFTVLNNRIKHRIKKTLPAKKEKPLVSICLNPLSEVNLIQQLDAIKNIQYKNFEVIIAMQAHTLKDIDLEEQKRKYDLCTQTIEWEDEKVKLKNKFLKKASGNYIKIIENGETVNSDFLDVIK